MFSTASTVKNACAITILLFAESSSVRSIHCVEAVIAALTGNESIYLASAQILSQRIGFLLYAIAEEPI